MASSKKTDGTERWIVGDVRQVAVTYVGGTYLGSALIELSNMAVLLNGPTTGSWKHFCTQPSMTWGGGGVGGGGGVWGGGGGGGVGRGGVGGAGGGGVGAGGGAPGRG